MIVLSLKYSCFTAFNSKNKNKKFQINSAVTHGLITIKQNTSSDKHFLQISMILILSNQFWVPLLQTQKRRNDIYTETLIVLLYLIATKQKNYCKLQI